MIYHIFAKHFPTSQTSFESKGLISPAVILLFPQHSKTFSTQFPSRRTLSALNYTLSVYTPLFPRRPTLAGPTRRSIPRLPFFFPTPSFSVPSRDTRK